MRRLRFPAILATLAALLLAAGCGPSLKLEGMEEKIVPGKILDLKNGAAISRDELFGRLGKYQVVVIGEYHNDPEQHQRQIEIIQSLWLGNPTMAIGLEVFSKNQQELLDDWISRKLDDQAFMMETAHGVLGPDTLAVYYPLLKWARDNQVPLLALDAPREVAMKVAREGLSSLNADERLILAYDLELGPEEYRQRVLAVHAEHPGKTDPMNFFTAQVARDETMAETMANFMNSEAGTGRRGVIICGNEHVMYGNGVPRRLARRFTGPLVTLVMPALSESEVLSPQAAEYAWLSNPSKRRRLGVVLGKNEAGQVIVDSVIEDSEAERIGLIKGDILLKLDGQELTDLMAMHRAALEGDPDREHVLIFQRADQVMEKSFRFK